METLKFCGDVWLPKGSDLCIPSWLSEGLVINLEAPITTRGTANSGKICLATDPDAFSKSFPRTPLIACLANNHIMDYGVDGFKDTISELTKKDIKYYGAGTLEENGNNPLVFNLADRKFALMGYVCKSTHPVLANNNTPGVIEIDVEKIGSDIESAKKQGADTIIVTLHWGEEEVHLPKPNDVNLAKRLMGMGADLIIGHHSHCRQPVMLDDHGRHAFFGLGNALFPDFEYRSNTVRAWSKQRSWNRLSTIVSISTTGVVSWFGIKDDRPSAARISKTDSSIPVWKNIPGSEKYTHKYNRAWRFGKMRLYISRMLARPHLPSPKAVVNLILSSIARN